MVLNRTKHHVLINCTNFTKLMPSSQGSMEQNMSVKVSISFSLPQKECFGSLARAFRAFLMQCEMVRMIYSQVFLQLNYYMKFQDKYKKKPTTSWTVHHLLDGFNYSSYIILKYFPERNSESCQTSKIEYFPKNRSRLSFVNYFCIKLHPGCLTKFWIHLFSLWEKLGPNF